MRRRAQDVVEEHAVLAELRLGRQVLVDLLAAERENLRPHERRGRLEIRIDLRHLLLHLHAAPHARVLVVELEGVCVEPVGPTAGLLPGRHSLQQAGGRRAQLALPGAEGRQRLHEFLLACHPGSLVYVQVLEVPLVPGRHLGTLQGLGRTGQRKRGQGEKCPETGVKSHRDSRNSRSVCEKEVASLPRRADGRNVRRSC